MIKKGRYTGMMSGLGPNGTFVPSSIRHSAEKTCRVTATGSKKSEKEGRPLERITVRGFENGRSQREDAYQFYGLSI